MFPFIRNPYDELSIYILGLLTNFSSHIMDIEESINELLKIDELNKNNDFLHFVNHFGLGRYYHFRCQGYMESLVVTKCYSPTSICYWLNSLVYPAGQHFMEALSYLDKIKTEPSFASNSEFRKLLTKIDAFKQVSMRIFQAIRLYHLPC